MCVCIASTSLLCHKLSQLRIRQMEEWARYISSIQEIAVICIANSTSRATKCINDAVELGIRRKAAGEKITYAIRNYLLRRRMSVDLIIRMWHHHQQVSYEQ